MVKRKKGAGDGDDAKPTKEEKSVAYHVRFNCPTKTTMVHGDEVHYFPGSKAIDCLMQSKWAAGKAKEPLFPTRGAAVAYMQRILDKGMISRARKLVQKQKNKDDKDKKKKADTGAEESPKKSRRSKEAAGTSKDDDKDDEKKKKDDDDDKKDEKKKKRKMKLDLHADQTFIDKADVVYMWHYDPVSWTKALIGAGMVIGSIVVCLFPLWPLWLRQGVYYCSLGAMGLIGVLLALVVLRTILFGVVWAATMGKHHFWFLPNLTEDCGFFESFAPLYTHETFDKDGKAIGASATKKSKKKRKNSEEEEEEEADAPPVDEGGNDDEEEEDDDDDDKDDGTADDDAAPTDTDAVNASEDAGGSPDSAAATRRRRRVRREDDNGFEMVN